jgi:hypothetical protein
MQAPLATPRSVGCSPPSGSPGDYAYDGSPQTINVPDLGDVSVGPGGPYLEDPTLWTPNTTEDGVTLDFDGYPVAPTMAALNGDGNLVVAGQTESWLFDDVTEPVWGVFGTDGSRISDVYVGDPSQMPDVGWMSITPNGQILLSGDGNGGPTAVRYNANGTLDTSFGFGGALTLPDSTGAFVEDTDGTIISMSFAGLTREAPVSTNVPLTVYNVQPGATPQTILDDTDHGDNITFKLNSAFDPSSDDTTAGFHYLFNGLLIAGRLVQCRRRSFFKDL